MSDTRPGDLISQTFRVIGWILLVAGAALGILLPAPITTALWTAASRAFARGGDKAMVLRLLSATKFGPRIRRNLNRPRSRPIGGVCEA